LTFSEQRKEPILEIHLDKVLEGLNMDRKKVRLLHSCTVPTLK
jgi:hypothetical protein